MIMESQPLIPYIHLSSCKFHKDGSLFVASSSLTRQYWLGQLWKFSNPYRAITEKKDRETTVKEHLNTGVSVLAPLSEQDSSAPHIICGVDSGSLQIWKEENGLFECFGDQIGHHDVITSISVKPGSAQAISASPDKMIKIWNLDGLVSLHTFAGHSDIVHCVAAHPSDADVFLSCSQDGRILIWDTRFSKPATIIKKPEDDLIPTCVCWQPNHERSFAVGFECGSLAVFDIRSMRNATDSKARVNGKHATVLHMSSPHKRKITQLAFSPLRETWLASASEDCTAAVSEITNNSLKVVHTERRHTDFVEDVSWYPETGELFTCAWDGNIFMSTVGEEVTEQSVTQATEDSMESSAS